MVQLVDLKWPDLKFEVLRVKITILPGFFHHLLFLDLAMDYLLRHEGALYFASLEHVNFLFLLMEHLLEGFKVVGRS